jgi:hypothetical protein
MAKKIPRKSKDPSIWRILLHYPIQFLGSWRMYFSIGHGLLSGKKRKEKPEKVIVEERM